MMRPLGFRYRALLALSRLALFWEAAWPRLWPIFAVIGAFVFVSLLDVLPALPGWLHGLVLVGFAAALGRVAWRSWRGLRPVTRAAARHRLERDSGLDHRPLTALEDTLTGGGGDGGEQDGGGDHSGTGGPVGSPRRRQGGQLHSGQRSGSRPAYGRGVRRNRLPDRMRYRW